MKKLNILLLTAVLVMVFSTGAFAFLPENDYSLDLGTSRAQISPSNLNNMIAESNQNRFTDAENAGYDVNYIPEMEEMSSYYTRLLYQANEPRNDGSSLAPNLSNSLEEENIRMGWQYEYLRAEVSGDITGYDNDDLNPKETKETYSLSSHGLGLFGEYSSRKTFGPIASYSVGYYYGNMTNTVRAEETKTEKETIHGFGMTADIGAVVNLDPVSIYGKAGYRFSTLSGYDLNGVQYSAGVTIRF